MERETVFTLEATPIKFGPGAVADAGWELRRLGVERALLVTDPGVAAIGIPDRVRESLAAEGIEAVVYDRARVEPTLDSLQDAADFAREAGVDGFVSVGGGSSIDTAKVADLIVSHPAPVMDYVNPPVGEGRKPSGPLRPHLATVWRTSVRAAGRRARPLTSPSCPIARPSSRSRRRRSSTAAAPPRTPAGSSSASG